MKDYHAVLGVGKGASKEEIQNAYRTLVKKYHPDKYRNNPLSDLAEEKMKEINEAYNFLMSNSGAYYEYQEPQRYNNQYGGKQGGNPFGGNPFNRGRYDDYYRGAQNRGYNGRRGNDDCCNTLCTIWCCDTCCECGGCDLIECL